MPSCPRCGWATAAPASFCSACGSSLARHGGGSSQARKMVTVMFADVSGFTALGERLDPESLQQVMSRYFAAMRRVVARHGGTVEKLIGDAIMAIFGVPVLHEDDALRAARCALDMQAALETLNEELSERWDVRLRTHTGINTGEVVVSAGPDGEPLTYGDTVNVAQRLEGAAAPGEILVGAVTAGLLHSTCALTAVMPLRLKGKADLVEAWRLDTVRDGDQGAPGPVRELVGRRTELDALRLAFDRAVEQRCPTMVTLTGPAGIGKSRLARALVDRVSGRAAVAAGRCVPYGEGITYLPLAEIVRRLAGRVDELAVAELAGGGAEARTIAHRLARVLGVAAGSVPAEEGQWAARRLLEIRAERGPLIVVVDDIHWAAPTLLDLLEYVVKFAADVPLFVMCLARPELLDRRPDWARAGRRRVVMPLGPLPYDDAADLLARLTAGARVAPPDAARVLATAEGNPFFLEQIVAMRAEPGEGAASTPASIQALLAARIDSLPPTERAVIDRAAVEGRGFHRSAVAELLPDAARGDLDDALATLTRRELIRPGRGDLSGEAGYRFVHILVRDVAYELLPKVTRAELHERYAGWLERRTGARYGELVGYHLEQAHRWHAELRPSAAAERLPLAAAAAERLGAAGRSALDRGDLPAGVNLLERTAALLPRDHPARAPVLPELGLALVQLGRLPEAETLLIEATRTAAARGDRLAEAHARTAQFFALVQIDPESAADVVRARFESMRRTFTAVPDDLGLSRLWRARALVHWLVGRAGAAEEAWMRAVRHARHAGDEQGRADALVWLASASCAGPRPVSSAVSHCEAILRQLTSDRRSQALSMRPLGALHAMAGRFDAAHDLLERSNAIHDELGVSMHAAVAYDAAVVALLAGDPAEAEAVLRPSWAYLQEIGERALFASIAGLLARARLEQGDDDEAWRLSDVAEETSAPDDLSAQVLWRTVRAEVLAHNGGIEQADRLSADAVALAARTDFVSDHADALIVRGDVLRAAGRLDEAATALRHAVALYTRKGNVVGADRARSAIDALTAGRAARR